jgi:uncharacterized membrane protein
MAQNDKIFTLVYFGLTYGVMTIIGLWTLISAYIEYRKNKNRKTPFGSHFKYRDFIEERCFGSVILNFWGIITCGIGLLLAATLITQFITK